MKKINRLKEERKNLYIVIKQIRDERRELLREQRPLTLRLSILQDEMKSLKN